MSTRLEQTCFFKLPEINLQRRRCQRRTRRTMATASTPRSSWRTTTTSSLVGFSKFFFLLQPSSSGDYAKTLEKETFTDAKKTNYLEAVKYVANLVWNGEILLTSLSIVYVLTSFIPQSTRSNRRPATLTSLAPWSTWTSSTPSSSASTPRAS